MLYPTKKIESHKLTARKLTANLPPTANVHHHPGSSGLAQPWLLHAILSSARRIAGLEPLAVRQPGVSKAMASGLFLPCVFIQETLSASESLSFCNLQQNLSKPILCGSSTCQ